MKLLRKTENNIEITTIIQKDGEIRITWTDRRVTLRKYPILLKKLKLNGCAACGYSEHNFNLDFHHVNPSDKLFLLHTTGMQYKNQKIVDEVNKCILLCKHCHGKLHNGVKL